MRSDCDHPRMRGEHVASTVSKAASAGSSPHARGTPQGAAERPEQVGIIPACAGNTTFPSLEAEAMRDHPRMRGEHRYFGDLSPKH